MIRPILLLGDPLLYAVSAAVEQSALPAMEVVVTDLHDTLMDYRARYGAGRAIAAPQIGVAKRLIYMCIDAPVVFVNPVLTFEDDDMMDVLDDCMSFPGLYVRLRRHRRCRVDFSDLEGNPQTLRFEGDLSELIQHEYDHLDGILATQRGADATALVMRRMGEGL